MDIHLGTILRLWLFWFGLHSASSDLTTKEANSTEMRCDAASISVLFLRVAQKSLDVRATV
jgi:hypothetical protein